jgi:DNA-binding response OmpR family regulator
MEATLETTVFVRQATVLCDTEETRGSSELKKSGGKILVIDDEPEVVSALTMRLKYANYEVISAIDGAAATRAAIMFHPDLIILDIGIPVGDGHTVAMRLSENLATVFIPIIFLTARSSQLDRDRAISVGAFDYITKPYTPDRLLKAVERALDTRKT